MKYKIVFKKQYKHNGSLQFHTKSLKHNSLGLTGLKSLFEQKKHSVCLAQVISFCTTMFHLIHKKNQKVMNYFFFTKNICRQT